jgi:predicted branched-subunit amino acid permease
LTKDVDAERWPVAIWALRGMRAVLSVPAAILLTSMAGYGVLCRESGLSFGQAIFSTAAIWALPSQVVLVSAIAKGASLPVAALGVALSAIRFVPMIASWVPLVRTERPGAGSYTFWPTSSPSPPGSFPRCDCPTFRPVAACRFSRALG